MIRFVIYILIAIWAAIYSFKKYDVPGDSRLVAGYTISVSLFAFAVGVYVPYVSYIGIMLIIGAIGWFTWDSYNAVK